MSSFALSDAWIAIWQSGQSGRRAQTHGSKKPGRSETVGTTALVLRLNFRPPPRPSVVGPNRVQPLSRWCQLSAWKALPILHFTQHGTVWAGQATLALQLGVDVRQVRRAIAVLLELKVLSVERPSRGQHRARAAVEAQHLG